MAVSIRTAPSGPLIQVKVRPLEVKKDACFSVLTRNMRPGPSHGRWEPITTSGFTVVCPSKLEACELVWMVGGKFFPRPVELIHDDDQDEERYLDWLLTHHFRIEPYVAGQPLEVMFSEFIRGWYPGAEDIPGVGAKLTGVAAVERLLRNRWAGR